MRIKWLVDTLVTKEIKGKETQLIIGQEYDVNEDDSYFKDAIARGWAEKIGGGETTTKKTTKAEGGS